MTTQTTQTTINAARRAALLAELDRVGLSPDGVQMMLDDVQASHVRAMIAGRRAVPADLLIALADLEPVA